MSIRPTTTEPRRALLLLGVLLLVTVAACDFGEDLDFGEFDLIPDIVFVPDAAPAPRSASLQGYEYSGSSGVDVGLFISEVDDLRAVSYTVVWDPTLARFELGGLGEHLGNMAGDSSFESVLVNGRQGRLRVTHEVAAARPAVSGSGFAHFLTFQPCVFEEECQEGGTTGLFVEDVVLLDDAGRPIPVTWSGGRLVVTR